MNVREFDMPDVKVVVSIVVNSKAHILHVTTIPLWIVIMRFVVEEEGLDWFTLKTPIPWPDTR